LDPLSSCIEQRLTSINRAMYFIDDTNSTIQYFAGWKPWSHMPDSTASIADISKCYNQTYVVSSIDYLCSQPDGCHFQIPFTGSGITIYVLQSYYPLNTTVTLDGTTSTIASIANLPGPTDIVYNVSLYDAQFLPTGYHIVDVALGDYTLSNGTTMGSLIRFDAAAVNETAPSAVSPSYSGAGTTMPTGIFSTPTTVSSSVPSQSRRAVLGFYIGGAFGGTALIAAIVLALLFCRRRKTPKVVAEVSPEPTPMSSQATFLPFDPASELYGSDPPQTFVYGTTPTFPNAVYSNWRTSLQSSRSSVPSDSTTFIFSARPTEDIRRDGGREV